MASIHVHDVPEDVLAKLRSRADEAHQSLEAYIKGMFNRETGMLSMAEAAERAEKIATGSGVTTDDILAAIEEDRTRFE